MRSPGREPTVVDLTKSNAEDATSSFHQTDITYSTNELPEAMSQRQPSFVHDDVVSTNDIGHLSSTNESHTYVSKPMPRRKLPLSRLLTSSRSDSKNENKVKKSISRKKRAPLKFKYYHHPGAMAAITSAMESLDPHGDDSTSAAPANDLDDSLVIRLKYKNPDTTTTSKMEENAIKSSPVQHQRVKKRDVMRITSVLNNDPAPSTLSPPSSSFDSSVVASNDGTSPSPPRAPSLNMPDRYIEHTSADILDHMLGNNTANAHNQLAKAGLQDEYIAMLTRPERQRYEDALVEIVGDLELPFFGGRFGSGG